MLILWFRKNKTFRQNVADGKNNQLSSEGNDVAQQFRLEHPDVTVSNAKDIMTEDGNLLASIEEVKLWENIQN